MSGELRADLDYLCSDKLAGRVSLSPEADMAARYIEAAFKKAGLAEVSLQKFPLVAYDPDPNRTALRLRRGGKTVELRAGSEFRGGFWRDVDIAAPVVFAGYGITVARIRI